MSRQRRLHLFPVVWLTLVWVMLWGELSWANVLAGLVLGILVLVLFPLPRVVAGVRVRPVRTTVVVVRFLTDVLVASFQVAWLAVRPQRLPPSAVVVVDLVGREELFQTVVAEMTSLVPGSVVIDLESASGRLVLHVLAANTPEKVEDMRERTLDLERRVINALSADPEATFAGRSGFDLGANNEQDAGGRS